MKTGFGESPAIFRSASQSARVDTEQWAEQHMFCPNCGNARLAQFPANRPVADFFCENCGDEYELKSQHKRFGRKMVNGAYHTKIQRLASDTSPNLILLHYDRESRQVRNLTVVPRFFFVSSIVEKRKPLSANARRAGWIGSNILLDRIPASGRIQVIEEGEIRTRSDVVQKWNQLRFVEKRLGEARGWLREVMNCVDKIGSYDFTISDIYSFEDHLAEAYPNNNNVRPKIRQQLQVLRDGGYLQFLGNGKYRRRR